MHSNRSSRCVRGTSHKLLALCGAAAAALICPAPGFAAARAPGEDVAQVEEIIVSARRREEDLQKTPVSIIALSAESLEARSVSNIGDLSQFTPNVTIAPDFTVGDAASSVFIRGIGQTDYRIFSDPAVATYVDGVFIPRALGGLMDIMDLERVEVLRGPQGTLYGKNSVAGAINLVSRKPQAEPEGFLQFSLGDYKRYEIKGGMNAPITDNLYVRVSGIARTFAGWGKVINDVDLNGNLNESARRNDQELAAGRVQLLWTGEADLEALLSIDGTRSRGHGSLRHGFGTDNRALGGTYNSLVTANRLKLPLYNTALVPANPYQRTANFAESSSLNIFGASLTVTKGLGPVDLKSVTSYRTLNDRLSNDIDATQADIWKQVEYNDQHQWGQELQASGEAISGRLNYVLGLFYFEETSKRDLTSVQLEPLAILGLYPTNVSQKTSARVSSTSYAAYGQGTFHVTDALSLTAGLRWTKEEKSMSLDRLGSAGLPGVTPVQGIKGQNAGEWSDVSPRFGIEYQWTPDLMSYASAARGFKSGGFNGRPSPLLPNNGLLPFDPETLTTYETGLRSTWFDNRLRLNATVFFSKYDDIQTTATQLVNGVVTVIVGNAASATMKGAELELTTRPHSRLRLDANLGYIDAAYDDITGAATLFKGNRNGVGQAVPAGNDSVFPLSPKYSANLGAELQLPLLESHGELKARFDASYQSKSSPDTNPWRADAPSGALLPKSEELDARTIINARLSYSSADGRYDLAAYVTNLADERYRASAVDFNTGFGFEQFGPPRQYGVSLKVNF